jgi:hypothetical protein
MAADPSWQPYGLRSRSFFRRLLSHSPVGQQGVGSGEEVCGQRKPEHVHQPFPEELQGQML